MPDKYIISVDWNNETYQNPPIIINRNLGFKNLQLLDIELQVIEQSKGKIDILFKHSNFEFIIHFSLADNKLFRSEDEVANSIFISKQYREIPLLDYLNINPLVLYFSDFSSLIGYEYYKKNFDDLILTDEDILEPIDWEENNVDIECEIDNPSAGKISIQEFLNYYLSNKQYEFLYYDHGTGEIADFIAVKEYDNRIVIQFYHCKGSGGEKAGDRVNDVYEVCGQVIKSSIWTDIRKLNRKIKDRMNTHENASDNPHNYIRDSFEKFMEVIDSGLTKMIEFEIVLVQPGITKSGLSEKISSVIAAADDFCNNQGFVPLRVFCSK